jgi:crossover junction endodeoxyribonuclease RuvC
MIIGIDPGVTGAIAFLEDKTFILCAVHDMPTMLLGQSKQQVNEAELVKIINFQLSFPHTIILAVYLERVSAMPGQGVTGMFNFGMSYGSVKGVVAALGLPLMLVSPAVWKRKAGILHNDKDAARVMAQHLYPEASLGRKKDVGRADAILIARYGGE